VRLPHDELALVRQPPQQRRDARAPLPVQLLQHLIQHYQIRAQPPARGGNRGEGQREREGGALLLAAGELLHAALPQLPVGGADLVGRMGFGCWVSCVLCVGCCAC
jgi:hypothetical protein